MKTKDGGLERTLRTYFWLGSVPQRKGLVLAPPLLWTEKSGELGIAEAHPQWGSRLAVPGTRRPARDRNLVTARPTVRIETPNASAHRSCVLPAASHFRNFFNSPGVSLGGRPPCRPHSRICFFV